MQAARNAQLVVDETGIAPHGWRSVDIDALHRQLRTPAAGWAAGARLGTAQITLRNGDKGKLVPFRAAPRLRRVPDEAFVVIGRTEPPIANDNASKPRTRPRTALRDIVMLALLAATLAGAFYSGRLHAIQNVIVVPPPASERNALT
jgi:hypothetical protein